ncbi:MAG: hypothetical protein IPG50_18035 [Myxococcales bacterium]|nr:hypothetical protein [Myxococcales bacterium]
MRPLFLTLGFAVACGAPGATEAEEPGSDLGEVRVKQQEVSGAGTPPLLEVSALGLRDGKLLSLGDRDFKIAVDGSLDGRKVSFADDQLRDLTGAFPANPRGAQWEGITSDGSGRLFLLEENPGRIFVLDREGRELVHTVTLRVPVTNEEWTAAWNDSANSRGEGLVLLKNGHVLVAKEKDPKRIVEFGPEGERASGYRPGSEAANARFPTEGRASTMVPLMAWRLKGDADNFADISELAVGPGGLYVLSDESRAIARLPLLDKDDDAAEADEKWKLPFNGDDEKTEGLVILPGEKRVALVALDGPKKDNLMRVPLD